MWPKFSPTSRHDECGIFIDEVVSMFLLYDVWYQFSRLKLQEVLNLTNIGGSPRYSVIWYPCIKSLVKFWTFQNLLYIWCELCCSSAINCNTCLMIRIQNYNTRLLRYGTTKLGYVLLKEIIQVLLPPYTPMFFAPSLSICLSVGIFLACYRCRFWRILFIFYTM